MKHISEDKLLEFALETCEKSERSAIEDHLEVCAGCRESLERVRSDIELIGSIRPDTGFIAQPIPERKSILPGIMRIAAVIALGFVLGYGSSSLTKTEPVCVSTFYERLSPPADSVAGYAIPDATGLPVR